MDTARLNEQFGLNDSLRFIESSSGIPLISVNNRSAKALISLFGGQVLSYRAARQRADLLFVSKKAKFDGKKPIRGGIPVCWPWFGPDPEGLHRPNHGFARNSLWEVSDTETHQDNETKVTLRLARTGEYHDMWPYAFDLKLIITVGSSLTLELVTRNTGTQTFSITQALHAYYHIGDIDRMRISGLEDKNYIDKLEGDEIKQQRGPVAVSEHVDRIYTEVHKPVTIQDPAAKRSIGLDIKGGKTAIVWNPWANAAAVTDLDEDDYKHFVCVEAGNAGPDAVTLPPGSAHSLLTKLQILSDLR